MLTGVGRRHLDNSVNSPDPTPDRVQFDVCEVPVETMGLTDWLTGYPALTDHITLPLPQLLLDHQACLLSYAVRPLFNNKHVVAPFWRQSNLFVNVNTHVSSTRQHRRTAFTHLARRTNMTYHISDHGTIGALCWITLYINRVTSKITTRKTSLKFCQAIFKRSIIVVLLSMKISSVNHCSSCCPIHWGSLAGVCG